MVTNTGVNTPPAIVDPNKQALETAIKSGNFTSDQALQYNQMIGSNTATSELMKQQPQIQQPQIQQPTTETPKIASTGNIPVQPTIATPQIQQPTTTKQNTNVNEAINPQYQQNIDKALETIDPNKIRDKLKEGVVNGTIDTNIYNQANNYLAQQIQKQNLAQNNPDYILTQMLSGQTSGFNKNTPEYQSALKSYGVISSLKNSSGKDIYDNIQAGTITEGSADFIKLGMVNPQAIEQYKIYKENKRIADSTNSYSNDYYDSLNSVSNIDSKKSISSQSRPANPVENMLQALSDKLTQNVAPDVAQLWKQKISQNPDVVNLTKTVSDYNAKLQNLSQQKVDMEDTIKAELKGTGATQDYIDAKIRERLKGIYKEENNVNIAMNNAQNQLTAITQNAKDEIELQQKQYQMQQDQFGNYLNVAKMGIDYAQQQQAQEQKAQELEAQKKQQEFENVLKLQELQSKLGDRKTTILKDEATGEQRLIDSQTGETIQSFKTGLKPETMTPYQTAQTELDKKKYELELAKFNAEQAGGGSTISGNINFTITPGTTNNRPDRNNNPGNVKGGQGIGKDDQGHTIFATPEQGYQAMIDDLTAKQTGNSTRVSKITGKKLGPDSTLADLGSVYAEDPKWGQNVARLSGYSTQTLLKNIDINKLAPAIAKQEGFTGTIGTGQKEYTESQKNLMNMIDTKNISKIEEAQLKKAGLGIQDVANYKTANPKADTDTVLKIRTHFDALPEVKDWDTAQGVREWLRTAKSGNLSGPDIQGLISNYAKILDPTSVVRELEYTMAQSGASQGVIDKTKQQIATFIAGGSNVLSKDAQGVLVKAMQKRLDAMETAYLNKAKQEVKRTNALGIPLTIEQLTGEQEVQPQTNTTQANKTESTQFSPAIQNIKKTYLNY